MLKIAVASGKGGTGKTTIALEMARVLAEKYSVGLFDADVTGANTHLRLRIKRDLDVKGSTIYPAIAEIDGDGKGIEYLSISLISDSYVRWGGDSVGDFISQLIGKTNWTCNYLVVDAPPGTHQDTVKAIEASDVVVFVTIPSKFAYDDLEKSIELVRDIGKPIAGVFLNFTHVNCPCGNTIKLFDEPYRFDLPIIQKIPFGDVRIDLDRLMYCLNNPVKKVGGEQKLRRVRREFVKMLLRTASKL